MSPDTPVLLTPERTPENTGWRVWAECRQCHAIIPFDSPDELDGEPLGKPGELAVRMLGAGGLCDECDVEQEKRDSAGARAAAFRDRLAESGLPKALHGYPWGDMEREGGRRGAIAAAHSWAENGGGLLIYGDVGTGKTRLAATATWEALKVRSVQWVSVPTLMAWALAEDRSDERRRALRAVAGDSGLVLDDLGKEKPSEWAKQVIFGAVDRRIQAGASLIVTSNYNADELADRMGDWLGSRLAAFTQVELTGRDRRLS